MNYPKITDMVGKTFTKIHTSGHGLLTFENEHERFEFYHDQDCCESVWLEDVVGDLPDLIGTPILKAEEVEGSAPSGWKEDEHDCVQFTFYKFATIKGYVDLRFIGESNGYYSTDVSLKYQAF